MRLLLLAMWVGWLAYWAIAARGAKATQWREPLRANWLHYTLAWIGTIVLLAPRATPAILAEPFLPPTMIGAVLGVVLHKAFEPRLHPAGHPNVIEASGDATASGVNR